MKKTKEEELNLKDISIEDPETLFEKLECLGKGSFGSVYKMIRKQDSKIVAVKVIHIERDNVSSINKEIHILKSCDSEFVVRYYGCYKKDDKLWVFYLNF